MILCLDVGNSQIYGGVFLNGERVAQFRKTSTSKSSSDEYGIFLRSALRENGIDPKLVQQVAICSVVPDVVYSLKSAIQKYFDCSAFILQAGVKTGLKIKYNNPLEVGADRISNSIAAVDLFPKQNLIIIDFGTATTFCAINSSKEYLGGVIIAGLKISAEALEARTAKLPSVEILKPQQVVGRSTIESIQSGLFYGQLGMIKEISERIKLEAFNGEKALVIGTGGFSQLFVNENIFDYQMSDLVLKGLLKALQMNGYPLQKETDK